MSLRREFENFATEEAAAITADWTVMSAAIVGLGVATMSVVSGGVENLSWSISSGLTDISVPGYVFSTTRSYDFSDGFGDWVTSISSHADPTLVDVLGPFYDQSGEEVVSNSFTFAPGTEFAVIEFDLTTVGRWEPNDDFRLFVDGDLIDASSLRNGAIEQVLSDDSDETQVAYRFIENRRIRDDAIIEQRLEIANNTIENGATRDLDAIRSNVNREADYTVQVVVRNPQTSMDFGMGRSGRSPYPGEAWAIDNVVVEASETDPSAPSG